MFSSSLLAIGDVMRVPFLRRRLCGARRPSLESYAAKESRSTGIFSDVADKTYLGIDDKGICSELGF